MTRRAKRDTSDSPWQVIEKPANVDGSPAGIRRVSVLGGWLYQVARFVSVMEDCIEVEWHPPVFIAGMGSSDGGAV